MTNDATKLADLPSAWEAEAAEIDARRESGEVSGEVWDTRYDILTENASDLRLALSAAEENKSFWVPSSAMRLVEWLVDHETPETHAPETYDICDMALAKLQEMQELLDAYRKHAKL